MTLAIQLRRYARELAAIAGLILIAAVVSGYILAHQRLRFPWEDVYKIRAEFASAQAVTPGQGQNVQVAGVTVGEITHVSLRDGRAVIEMEIERPQVPRVHRDATMLLRPKTGLNDMSIQLDPGTPAAPALEGDDVLPVSQTRPHVNPDEVLAALDADTRDYLAVLVNEGGRALRGRSPDLRALLGASVPALRHTRRITAALADRRRKVRRLVHNLRLLAEAAATKDDELSALVSTSAATLTAVAGEEDALRGALDRLPPTLAELRGALTGAQAMATRLEPALTALTPTVRALPRTLDRLDPLLRDATPILRDEIRPLVRAARPVARDLKPALRDLNAVTPRLADAFVVLNYVVNELAFNPDGPEEGYLFWLAWFSHNANSILSIEDAQGVAWRGQLIASCSTYAALPDVAPLLAAAGSSPVCPEANDSAPDPEAP